jgi:DNA damage-binding protein 1
LQVDGGVYLFGTINPEYMDLLMSFQAKLAACVESPGEISFAKYRASNLDVPHGEKKRTEPWRFVDGELLERFLDMSEPRQEVLCEELGKTAEYMRGIVERLRRML